MERLTGRKDGRAYIVGCPDFVLPKIAGLIIQQTVDRLAAYEDTGLEPCDYSAIGHALEQAGRAKSDLIDVIRIIGGTGIDRLRELAQTDKDGRCVVLDMPREPLVWGDDDQNACLCPYCGKDLMGIPYGERMVLQCPECGQYLDATKVITRDEAEDALRREQDG